MPWRSHNILADIWTLWSWHGVAAHHVLQVLRTLIEELGNERQIITFKQLIKALEGDDSPDDDDDEESLQASQALSVSHSGKVTLPRRAPPRHSRGGSANSDVGSPRRTARFDSSQGGAGAPAATDGAHAGPVPVTTARRLPPASAALQSADSSYTLSTSPARAQSPAAAAEAEPSMAGDELALELSLPEGTSIVQQERQSSSEGHGPKPSLAGMVMHGNDMFSGGISEALADSNDVLARAGMSQSSVA